MRSRRRLALVMALPLAAAIAGLVVFDAYVRGAAFVIKAAGMHGAARTVAEWKTYTVDETGGTIPWRGGVLPARTYLPRTARPQRTFLLLPGIHASGVDEPRLVGFARDLASMGHPVITAGPPDLARYAISPQVTDAIEDAAVWVAARRDLAPDGRIGLMGISFAGGLAIVAAGRPALAGKLAAVVSLGGHGDLPRTLRYLCTGRLADGTELPPHDYGVVIILLAVADRVVPGDQVDALRHGIGIFLEASRLDLVDKAKSQATFAMAVALEPSLPEPARTYMSWVNARDVGRLGPLLLPHIEAMGAADGLSPSTSPPPSAPVYLLHGQDDNVVPASESVLLARELTARGHEAHVLATPLITHAEVDRAATAGDMWQLVEFWGDVLDR